MAMESDLLASKLASRFRGPVAVIGAASAVLAIANGMRLGVPDIVAYAAAGATGLLAASIFICSVFDIRFQEAIFALNAERRAAADKMGWKARRFGIGLPVGDRLLFALSFLLVVVMIIAGAAHRFPAHVLSFAAFMLIGCCNIALMARGYPTNQVSKH